MLVESQTSNCTKYNSVVCKLCILHLADNRVAYNSLSREDSVDYDVSSPLARMESLRRDGGAETDTEVTAGSRKRVRVIKQLLSLSSSVNRCPPLFLPYKSSLLKSTLFHSDIPRSDLISSRRRF